MLGTWVDRKLQLVGLDDRPSIRRSVVDPATPVKRRLPEFVADLSTTARPHSLFAPQQVGHGKFQTTIGHVWVFGSHHFHAFLEPSGALSMQETDPDRLRARVDYHIANHPGAGARIPLIARTAPDEYAFTCRHLIKTNVVNVGEAVFFGSPIEPDNWGMWLLNGLSSARRYAECGAGAMYLCWLRFDWQRNLLRFMGISDEDLIVQEPWKVYECKSVTFEQYTKVDLAPTESDLAIFRSVRAKCGASAGSHSSRIFVSRRGVTRRGAYRALLNEDELIEALEAMGFATVEPEALSFTEQVQAFGAARIVVGLGGAGLFNVVFCDPAAIVVSIEGSTAFVENHAALFAGLGLRYAVILGEQDDGDPTEVHKRWTVNVAESVRRIRQLL